MTRFLSFKPYLSLLVARGFLAVILPLNASAAPTCPELMAELTEVRAVSAPVNGAEFLHRFNQSLHMSKPIEENADRILESTGRRLTQPADKIQSYLDYLTAAFSGDKPDLYVREELKKYFYDVAVTKFEDVPDGFFKLQARILRERGLGETKLTKKIKQELAENSFTEQRDSLGLWIDYLSSPDTKSYPMWIKYWILLSVSKLGNFKLESSSFVVRSKGQMSPFPELNGEALATVVEEIKNRNDSNPPSFSKLYGKALQLATHGAPSTDLNVDGVWVKFNQGDDHMPLVKSLRGKNTGWCTAVSSTAKSQLDGGDFYVYYSYDEKRNPTKPRVAIRMEDDKIAEVRGVGQNQNLDDQIAKSVVVEEKLKEFGAEGKAYNKKSLDMKTMTEIYTKQKANEDLTAQELRFLYELDAEILGFGYGKDPRIAEVRRQRKLKQDLSVALGASQNEISTTKSQALSGKYKYHYGSLDVHIYTANERYFGYTGDVIKGPLPEEVFGELNLKIGTIEGLTLPRYVRGNVNVAWLKSAQGLVLPQVIIGDLTFVGLKSSRGMVKPKTITGNLIIK